MTPGSVYLGTFLIALAALAFEVTLARPLSASTWYHLAFFPISTAILGMTAGAISVCLERTPEAPRPLNTRIATVCLKFSYTVPVALDAVCILPLEIKRSVMSLIAFLLVTAATGWPFSRAGVALTLVLTKSHGSSGARFSDATPSPLRGACPAAMTGRGRGSALNPQSWIFPCDSRVRSQSARDPTTYGNVGRGSVCSQMTV